MPTSLTKAKTKPKATPQFKPRNAFAAFFLSLFIPGLGQVYNGQAGKGILIFAMVLMNPFLFGLTRGATFFSGLVAVVLIEISLRIFSIVDAVINAKRQKEYIPKSYNTWYKHLLAACAMVAVLYIFDTKSLLGLQSYTIPSTRNQPTLQVGDWIVCDTKIFDSKPPGYGDLIVFKGQDGMPYPGRIVGLPGDSLAINDDIVSINGKPCKATFIKETTSDTFPVQEFEEEFPNGRRHNMYRFKHPFDSTKATMKNIVLPGGYYYILGDNRDNALDSRYVGFIPKEKITGKIIYSYWGETKDRINIDFRDK